MKYYKSLDTLPIWNWHKLHEVGDFRYLLRGDLESLPEITPHQNIELAKTHQKLIYDFEVIHAPLLKQKRNVAIKIIDLIIEVLTDSKEYSKIEKATTILTAMLVKKDLDIDWLYKVDFTDSAKQKDLLTLLAIEIQKYESEKEAKKEIEVQTLTDKTVRMEMELGIVIDIKTCSVLKFDSYERAVIEKIKWHKENK